MDRVLIAEVLDGWRGEACVQGWVRSLRKSKRFCFVVVSDGSCQGVLQVVVDRSLGNYAEVSGLLSGACVGVRGEIVASQGRGQAVEMQASQVEIHGTADESYPLQKKATSLEFLREKAHLRGRTNLFGAVFRVRHQLTMATHRFFDRRGFYCFHGPVLTSLDAEGAGAVFNVSADDPDYFGGPVHLCVTNQLGAEALALGLGAVYSFGPTFRAENSNTARHLSEFWMVEPEVAFLDLEGNADLAEAYVKCLIDAALEKAPREMEALVDYRQFAEKEGGDHLEKLAKVRDARFERLSYTQAIEILQSSGRGFEFNPEWGKELQTEHETFLVDHCSKPVIVTDYPGDCKAFYMKQNPDGKTVRAMDVLVPGMGEIIGGSQREDDLALLEKRIVESGLKPEPLWWYLELRKFGTTAHSGFGLGFERAMCYITGMKNIRDAIPFPRTPRHCEF